MPPPPSHAVSFIFLWTIFVQKINFISSLFWRCKCTASLFRLQPYVPTYAYSCIRIRMSRSKLYVCVRSFWFDTNERLPAVIILSYSQMQAANSASASERVSLHIHVLCMFEYVFSFIKILSRCQEEKSLYNLVVCVCFVSLVCMRQTAMLSIYLCATHSVVFLSFLGVIDPFTQIHNLFKDDSWKKTFGIWPCNDVPLMCERTFAFSCSGQFQSVHGNRAVVQRSRFNTLANVVCSTQW